MSARLNAAYNDQWATVLPRLRKAGGVLPWASKQHQVFWRGADTNLARAQLVAAAQAARTPAGQSAVTSNVTIMEWTGFTDPGRDFVSLDEQCLFQYLPHAPGHTYSAMLKYKLACGSVALPMANAYHEWWDRAIVNGTHALTIKKDASDLWDVVNRAAADPRGAATIAQGGAQLAEDLLGDDGVDCYWAQLLRRYVPLVMERVADCGGLLRKDGHL